MATLPTITATAGSADHKDRAHDTQTCSICMEDMQQSGGATTPLPELTELRCGHQFHRFCLDLWLVRKPSCPLCRAPCFPSYHWRTAVEHASRYSENEENASADVVLSLPRFLWDHYREQHIQQNLRRARTGTLAETVWSALTSWLDNLW